MINFFHRIQIEYQKHNSNAADDQPDTMLMFKQVSTFLFIDIIHRLCNGFVWRSTSSAFYYNLVFLDFSVLSRNLNFNSLKIKRSSQHMPKPMHKSENVNQYRTIWLTKKIDLCSEKNVPSWTWSLITVNRCSNAIFFPNYFKFSKVI